MSCIIITCQNIRHIWLTKPMATGRFSSRRENAMEVGRRRGKGIAGWECTFTNDVTDLCSFYNRYIILFGVLCMNVGRKMYSRLVSEQYPRTKEKVSKLFPLLLGPVGVMYLCLIVFFLSTLLGDIAYTVKIKCHFRSAIAL